MTKLLRRILYLVLLLSLCLSFYLSYTENIPFRESFFISAMLLSAGEPLSLNVHEMHWFSDVVVVVQTILGVFVFAIVVSLITEYVFSEKMRQYLEKEKITMKDHVILCGLGNVGYKVMSELERLGQKVVIIDWGDDKDFVERILSKGHTILKANLKEEKTLEDANIKEAHSLIICTGNDLLNMEVALNAREKRPDILIVMRMFDQRLADKIAHAFNIKIAFSSSEISAPVFAAASIDRSVFGSIKVGKEVFVSAQKVIKPGSKLEGARIDQFQQSRECTILKLISGEERIKFPYSERKLKGGDILYLSCTQEELQKIKKDNQ